MATERSTSPTSVPPGSARTSQGRGALTGFLLVALGIWAAFIPFVGPYFGYAFTPAVPWAFTLDRLWLQLLPGIVIVVCGVVLLGTAHRPNGTLAAWLAAAAGAWLVVGTAIWSLIGGGPAPAGVPVGGPRLQAVEQIGMFTGLGAVVIFLAALAGGRFAVRGVGDVRAAQGHDRTGVQ